MADGQADCLGAHPTGAGSDLDEDLDAACRDQMSLPAPGDPAAVQTGVPVDASGRRLAPAAVAAGAQHQPDRGRAVQREPQLGAGVLTALPPAQTISVPVADTLVI